MTPRKTPARAGSESDPAPGAKEGASGEPAPSFEEALERLEEIVEELEAGSLSLEESIARYEEGVKLSRRLTQTLDEAEKRIERLVESEGGGSPTTAPMELEESGNDAPGGSSADTRAPDTRAAARTPARVPSRPSGPPEPDELPF